LEVLSLGEILTVQDLGISFGSNHVLKSLNFSLNQNEILGVIGPNGAGKTVMLNILTGIYKPTKGSIMFLNKDITHLSVTERCRTGLGRTFQVPKSFEKMTVFENVLVGGVFGNGLSDKLAKLKAIEIFSMIGLEDKKDELAGKLGLLDRKRLEIGRALATSPKVLMLDEVAGGLTETEIVNMLGIVKNLKEQGISIIWIEHNIQTMLDGTDRILCLSEGRDVICGRPEEVIASKEVSECYLGAEEV
jgi:branched-chain amino acid transport system ATP-binding protein